VADNLTRMAWQPNRKQWAVIFGAAIVALFLWSGASDHTYASERQQQERAALSVLIVGALLVWFLDGKRGS
jgi:hypothetical protein